MGRGRGALEKEEFLALSNQKADDWRELTRISASFLGIAAAFFTAGMASGSAWVVVMSPLALLLGVRQLTGSARIQMQLITYLHVFSPFEETSWEEDIAVVRPLYWAQAEKGRLASHIERRAGKRGRGIARHITNPSAWDLWLVTAFLVGLGVDSVPLFAGGFGGACLAFGVGVLLLALGTWWVARDIARVEPERERWTELWESYKRGDLDESPDIGGGASG
jgi:hypothetical protein